MSENSIYYSILSIGDYSSDLISDIPFRKAGLSDITHLIINDKNSSSANSEFIKYEATKEKQQEILTCLETFFLLSPFSVCCIDIDSSISQELLIPIGNLLKTLAKPKIFIIFNQTEQLSNSAFEAINNLKKIHDEIIIFTGDNCQHPHLNLTLLSLLTHLNQNLQHQGDIDHVNTLMTSGLISKIKGCYSDDLSKLPEILNQHEHFDLTNMETMTIFLLVGEDFQEDHLSTIKEELIKKGWLAERCFFEIIRMKDWLDSFIICEISGSLFCQHYNKYKKQLECDTTQTSKEELPNQKIDVLQQKQSEISFSREETLPILEAEPQIIKTNENQQEITDINKEKSQQEITDINEFSPPLLITEEMIKKESENSKENEISTLTKNVCQELPLSITEEKSKITSTTLPQDINLIPENEVVQKTKEPIPTTIPNTLIEQEKKQESIKIIPAQQQVQDNKSPTKIPQKELELIDFSRGIFENFPINAWKGENLDIPTYLRQNLTLYCKQKEKKD